jgi:hypothetical protein
LACSALRVQADTATTHKQTDMKRVLRITLISE